VDPMDRRSAEPAVAGAAPRPQIGVEAVEKSGREPVQA